MLVGRPGLSPVMVGRVAELGRLAGVVEAGPAPAIALVGGEAGVGKTRLVRELLALLPAGTAVYAGQADPGSMGRPFELLLDAIDGGRGTQDERLAALTDRDRPADDRARIGLEIVGELTRRAPSVVVFDDLHWADPESVLFFERLAEPDSGPRLLVGTYRPDALTRRHPAADLLPRLERRHAVTHLHLDRLSSEEVGEFLLAVYGRAPSYRVVEALHARTGGNPFFLEELLSAAGEADPEQLMRQPLPWSLGELLRSQIDELSDDERCVLETAAVLGRRVGFDLLAAVSGYDERELISLLRRLVADGLLLEAEPDVFSFRHALAREAIEADLLGRERRRLHQAALDVLRAEDSDDAAAIAHHAHGAGRYDEMVAAARDGARRALDGGSSFQALQLAELGLSEDADNLELLRVASRAAWLTGLLPDALSLTERRLAVARRTRDDIAESAALRLLARVAFDLGDTERTVHTTDQLAALVDRLPDGPEKGKAYATLAQMSMLRVDRESTVRWSDLAIDIAQRFELPEIRVRAELEKGSMLINHLDSIQEGVALLEAAIEDASEQGQWVLVARGLNNLVRSDLYRPEPDAARALLRRMRDATERAGFTLFAGSYWDGLADLAEWEGDLGAALGYVEEALRARRTWGPGEKTPWYQAHAAGLALEAGEVDQAEALLALSDVQTLDDPQAWATRASCQPGWWLGLGIHVAARRGDFAAAAAHGALLQEFSRSFGGVEAPMVHDISRALLIAGMPVADVRAFVDGLVVAGGGAEPADRPYALLVEAQLLEAADERDAAIAAYERAIANDNGELRPSAKGTAHVGAGRLLVAAGRLDEAKQHALEAEHLLARWGGSRVEELGALERRLGGGEVPEGPSELTPREREVVALLADGLTNGELASRLFISPKTASVHVSNILAKLGMTSRAEVAAYAVRSGLADG